MQFKHVKMLGAKGIPVVAMQVERISLTRLRMIVD
jgi:hypothetical protein